MAPRPWQVGRAEAVRFRRVGDLGDVIARKRAHRVSGNCELWCDLGGGGGGVGGYLDATGRGSEVQIVVDGGHHDEKKTLPTSSTKLPHITQ